MMVYDPYGTYYTSNVTSNTLTLQPFVPVGSWQMNPYPVQAGGQVEVIVPPAPTVDEEALAWLDRRVAEVCGAW